MMTFVSKGNIRLAREKHKVIIIFDKWPITLVAMVTFAFER